MVRRKKNLELTKGHRLALHLSFLTVMCYRRAVAVVRAAHDYDGREEKQELSFKANDIISIVAKTNDTWWYAKLGSRSVCCRVLGFGISSAALITALVIYHCPMWSCCMT